MTPAEFRSRAFDFACDIVRLYRRLEHSFPAAITRQILKSGTSIGANLEEAKAAQSRSDLKAKFSIALKEARETVYWLRLIVATDLAKAQDIASVLEEAQQFVAMLTASVKNLKTPSREG